MPSLRDITDPERKERRGKPAPNLWLDRVTHVSLVDEPAVGDSEWVVAKRKGEETPEGLEGALEAVRKTESETMEENDLTRFFEELLNENQDLFDFEGQDIPQERMAEQMAHAFEAMKGRDGAAEGEAEAEGEEPELRTLDDLAAATATISTSKRAGASGSSGGAATPEAGYNPKVMDVKGAVERELREPTDPTPVVHLKRHMGAGPEPQDILKHLEEGEAEPETAMGAIRKHLEEEGDLPEHVEKQFNAIEKSMKNSGERVGTAPDTSPEGGSHVKDGKMDLLGAVKSGR